MLFGLFETQKEKTARLRKEKRKAFRQAEGSLDDLKLKVKNLQKDRDKAWQEARQYLKEGQKAAAQRCLQSVRAHEVMMDQLEKKRWLSEQFITKLDTAQSDADMAKAMKAVNTVIEIDPDVTADILDEVQDKLNDMEDINSLWDKAHAKEMEGVENLYEEEIPSVDAMMAELSSEVSTESTAVEKIEEAEPETVSTVTETPRRRLEEE